MEGSNIIENTDEEYEYEEYGFEEEQKEYESFDEDSSEDSDESSSEEEELEEELEEESDIRYTEPYFNDCYKDEDPGTLERIRNKLKSDGFDIVRFTAMLKNARAWIAGSYVLQAIIDYNWDDSDIDIWAIDKPYGEHFSPLCAIFTYFISKEYSAKRNWKALWTVKKAYTDNTIINKSIKRNKEISGYNRLRGSLSEMWTFKKKGYRKVQVLLLKPTVGDSSHFIADEFEDKYDYEQELKRYISQFDLSSCRTFFTGENVYGLHPTTIEEAKNKQQYITRESAELQSLNEWIRTLKRVLKYRNRGFDIIWDDKVKSILLSNFSSMVLKNEDEDVYGLQYNRDLEYNWGLENLERWNKKAVENYGIPRLILNDDKTTLTLFFDNEDNLTIDNEGNLYSEEPYLEQNEFSSDIDADLLSLTKNEKSFYEAPKDLPQCYDIIQHEFIGVQEYLRGEDNEDNKDNIIFVLQNGDDYNFYCYKISYLARSLHDKNNNIFYKCIGDKLGLIPVENGYTYTYNENDPTSYDMGQEYDTTRPYLKIPLVYNIFVPIEDIRKAFIGTHRIFYVTPEKDENGRDVKISHSASYEMVYRPTPLSSISANHCQAGSSIDIYRLKVCEGYECFLSDKFKNKPPQLFRNF